MRTLSPVSREAWLTLVFCVLLGGYILVETSGYPVPKAQGFGSGPAFYPRVLAGALIAIGMFGFIRDLRRSRQSPAENRQTEDSAPGSAHGQVAAFYALCAASTLAMAHLGFLISGFLLVFCATLLIRGAFTPRGTAAAAVYAAGIMALIYLVFSFFVGVQLPASSLFKFD
jgi:putative tricarboxylic transport membrane protein